MFAAKGGLRVGGLRWKREEGRVEVAAVVDEARSHESHDEGSTAHRPRDDLS